MRETDKNKNLGMNENNRTEEQAWKIARPVIEESGYKIWDVIFEKEGAMRYLRVLFDYEQGLKSECGITSEDCEKITVPLNALFDKQKFIENVDMLEIGSPGLTRRLRHPAHFNSCVNFPVRAVMRGEKGKTEVVYGILEKYDENAHLITIKNDNRLFEIDIKKCVRINLDL